MITGIKDKFDTDGAEHLVLIGYPENKEYLTDLIAWSCFPNDPVAWILYPYVSVLKDDIMAAAMAEFMEFHFEKNQEDMVEQAAAMFIYDGRENLIPLILEQTSNSLIATFFAKNKPC